MIDVAFIANPLVKILEKLVELIKYRRELNERQFEKIVEPLFEDLKTAHVDYLRMFTTLRDAVVVEDKPEAVIKKLMHERIEQEPLRRSIDEFAGAFAQNKRLKKYQPFFESVREYFYQDHCNTRRMISLSNYLFGLMLNDVENSDEEGQLTQLDDDIRNKWITEIDEILAQIRDSWTQIARLYAELLMQI